MLIGTRRLRLQMVACITRLQGRDLDDATKQQIRHLHDQCFVDAADWNSTMEEFFNLVTFLHDSDECDWFLMWSSTSKQELIGMMACAEYHTSLYCFSLCIHPLYRGQTRSKRLMLEAARYAFYHKNRSALSGTVEKSLPRLLAFYERMGGERKAAMDGISGPGTEASSITITRSFNISDIEAEMRDWDHKAAILSVQESSSLKQLTRLGVLGGTVVLLFVIVKILAKAC